MTTEYDEDVLAFNDIYERLSAVPPEDRRRIVAAVFALLGDEAVAGIKGWAPQTHRLVTDRIERLIGEGE